MALRDFITAQQKAIPYSMELTDLGGPLIGSGQGYYGAANPYVPGAVSAVRTVTPLSQREAFVHGQAYGGTEAVDWLMDAIDYVTQSASAACYHFEDDQGTVYSVDEDPNDPSTVKPAPLLLKKLFERPNPYQTYTELLELMLIDFLLVGNAYWVKWKTNSAQQPAALYRMAPHLVRILPGQFGVEKYLYKVPGIQNEVTFTPDQVIHFKRPNPHDPYYGLGIIKGGARAVDMEISLTNTAARYYENQAMPSGVVETERRVPKDVFQRIKSQMRAFYTGTQNAGQLMVLEAGLKFSAVSPDAGKAMFQQMGQWSRDRILAMFRLNKKLLGIVDESGRGDPTALSDWQRLFDQKTMIPLCKRISEAITLGLTKPGWGLEFEIDYEETQAPADMLERATLLSAMPGVKVHELREAAGLAPSTGDQTIDDTVLNLPGPELNANGQNGFPDRNLPGEAGRPPLPANTRRIAGAPAAFAGGTGSAVASGKAVTDIQSLIDQMSVRQKVLDHKALDPANVHVGEISNVIPPEDTLHAERHLSIDNLVSDTTRELLDAVHTLERGLLDSSEGKAEGTMYQRLKNSKAWAAFRAKIGTILENQAQVALGLANRQHARAGLEPNLETDYAAAAKELVYRNDGARGIVQTLKAQILQDILTLQRHGSNPGEFTRAIMDGINKWRDGHAELVALTEATMAYNEGTVQLAEHSGMNLLVSDGEEDDEPCVTANGQVWTPDQARARRIEHPRCRRAFVPTAAEASV